MIKQLKTPVLLTLLVAVLFFVLPGCAYVTGEAVTVPAPVPAITNVSPAQADNLIKSNQTNTRLVILDVRTPQEYADGHLMNAINLDLNSADFTGEVGRLNKSLTYLVYCRSGNRSAAAAKIMLELGFKSVYNMTGGITEWQAAGLPVVK